MDPAQVANLTAILSPVFGVRAAGVASIVIGTVFVLAQIMPYLPVASAASASWYRIAYGLIARAVGARGNNAPMPAAGNVPAGGLVPTPPALFPVK